MHQLKYAGVGWESKTMKLNGLLLEKCRVKQAEAHRQRRLFPVGCPGLSCRHSLRTTLVFATLFPTLLSVSARNCILEVEDKQNFTLSFFPLILITEY